MLRGGLAGQGARGGLGAVDGDTDLGVRERYRRIGLGLTGILRTQAEELWEGFAAMSNSVNVAPANWTHFVGGGTGAIDNQVTGTRSISRMTTGANAASSMDQFTNVPLGHQGTSKWYYATRFKVSTAVDAQARALQVLYSVSGNAIGVGFHGPVNAANFVAVYDASFNAGSAIDLGEAADTDFHVFEIWCLGDGVLRVRLDGGPIRTATMASAAVDFYLYHVVRNGTTAAARQMDRDWCLLLWESAS